MNYEVSDYEILHDLFGYESMFQTLLVYVL
jgi:hypothetical protein